MGQAALQSGALDRLPTTVDEATARAFTGKCWDDADWEELSGGAGSVAKESFTVTIQLRNHAPSMRTWLEFWRIDELTESLEELEVMCADDLCDLEPAVLNKFVNSLKVVQKVHWQKAMAHAVYLKAQPLGYMPWRPCGLRMWLESWRLGRIQPQLFEFGVDTKEDVLDLDREQWGHLDLRLLERKRWEEANDNLTSLVTSFNYLSQRKASVPTLETWLDSLRLNSIKPQLINFGVVHLMDLDDITPKQQAELGLNKLQRKHWAVGLNQVIAAKREAMADGKADLPTFRSCLEGWRLGRLGKRLREMGAIVQQDLLDLTADEYELLKMRPLESKRWLRMMAALEEEFETPPPGEEWTEDNMTRRAWRKQNAEKFEYSLGQNRTASAVTKLNAVRGFMDKTQQDEVDDDGGYNEAMDAEDDSSYRYEEPRGLSSKVRRKEMRAAAATTHPRPKSSGGKSGTGQPISTNNEAKSSNRKSRSAKQPTTQQPQQPQQPQQRNGRSAQQPSTQQPQQQQGNTRRSRTQRAQAAS